LAVGRGHGAASEEHAGERHPEQGLMRWYSFVRVISKYIRRTHMYLALFLAPWMLMYAVSTVVMNHRGYFVEKYGAGPAPYVTERRMVYDGVFPETSPPSVIARELLRTLDLDGSHVVNHQRDGTIVIQRNDLVTPRRVTYEPGSRLLLVEKQESRPNGFWERFHRRRGSSSGYALDTIWGVSIDIVIAAMVFWTLSGAWMCWELKATRRLGAVAILSGLSLFVVYVVTI
jgi:hypothetical protein